MNVSADAPFVSRPAPNLLAGVMALGVHVLFVLLLVFGVSWQTQHPAPVMVDLWESLPAVAPLAAERAPRPRPEPVKPAPAPVAKEPPSPKEPDIALEKKKAEANRLKKLQAIQAAEEKARAEAAKAAHDKQLAEQKKRELLRQMEDEDLVQRVANEAAANEARQAKLAEAQARLAEARAAAGKRQAEVASVVGQHRDLISAKVRGNTRLPDNLTGNPEVRCLVKLLPTGEVLSVRVTQSSGNVAYDEAVVRAIEKSSPLPLPNDRDARAAFVPELSFVHRPKQ
jgi:colicin import membrane protein